MEIHEFRAMNTEIVLAAEGNVEDIQAGFKETVEFIQNSESRFTRFSKNSELSQLNNANGAWFNASPDMFEVIQLARSYIELTSGLFDPSILRDLERIGYDRSMDVIRLSGINLPSNPSPSGRPNFSFDEILLKSDEMMISLPMGVSLDLGGIAKGWIAQKAAGILSEYSTACGVSAGGDMHLVGLPDTQTAWQVALDDPRNPGKNLAILNIPPGGIATSSVTKRTWKQAGKTRHHLIDPRTGEPAETEWLSVTVIAEDTSLCEVFAKTLLIAGSHESSEIAEKAGIAFLAVDWVGNIVGTSRSLEYIDGK